MSSFLSLVCAGRVFDGSRGCVWYVGHVLDFAWGCYFLFCACAGNAAEMSGCERGKDDGRTSVRDNQGQAPRSF